MESFKALLSHLSYFRPRTKFLCLGSSPKFLSAESGSSSPIHHMGRHKRMTDLSEKRAGFLSDRLGSAFSWLSPTALTFCRSRWIFEVAL